MEVPSAFVDNGTETFPEDLPEPSWLGIHKFSSASFAYAELYSADNVLRRGGYLDANESVVMWGGRPITEIINVTSAGASDGLAASALLSL